MKKALLIFVVLTFIIILISCSPTPEGDYIIEIKGPEGLQWAHAVDVFYYGPNSEGEVVCVATNGDVIHIFGRVLGVYLGGEINYKTGEVTGGNNLPYFDYRDDMLLYYH